MSFQLPDLPYSFDALEPFIDAQTMELHHDKHHASYVTNLNNALVGHDDLLTMPIEDLLRDISQVPEDKRQVVINNGGGHANHSLFWKIMKPKGGGEPEGELKTVIENEFESFDKFKELFTQKAISVFGSGWVFLIKKQDGSLEISRNSFQNTPLLQGETPILGLDVWEHAYYLKYQNRRAEYIENWWNVVNWEEVSKNLT